MKKVSYILSMVVLVTVIFSNFAQAQERKRWSPQAKGTVIGAGTGAAAGAIIHKRNRVAGGVVGGVVGGAAGYAIGKRVDNKNKEAARVAAANRAAANRAAAASAARSSRGTANRSAVASKKAENRTVAVSQPAGPIYNGYMAGRPNMMYDANGNAMPFAMNAAFLPNEHYGDNTKPYFTSEYRRKSW